MLQYDQIDASFLPDPAASIAMNARHRSLISTQELGIDFTVTAFSREAINEKRREIELLITGYNLGIDYIKMHPQKEWKQVLIEIGVPENLTGLIALPVYRKAERPSADALDKVCNMAENKQPDTSDIFRIQKSDRYNFYKNKFNYYQITTNHMRKTLFRLSMIAFALLGMQSTLTAQEKTPLNQVVNTLKERISLAGYAQLGYTYDDAADPDNTFDIKRIIFMAHGKITDRWTCDFMYDFYNGGMLLEVYTDYRILSGLTARIGEFKVPYTIENELSPTTVEPDQLLFSVSLLSGGSQRQ